MFRAINDGNILTMVLLTGDGDGWKVCCGGAKFSPSVYPVEKLTVFLLKERILYQQDSIQRNNRILFYIDSILYQNLCSKLSKEVCHVGISVLSNMNESKFPLGM